MFRELSLLGFLSWNIARGFIAVSVWVSLSGDVLRVLSGVSEVSIGDLFSLEPSCLFRRGRGFYIATTTPSPY